MNRMQIARERRELVARLIADAGPAGLAIRHLVEMTGAKRDAINEDMAKLKAACRVVHISCGSTKLSTWVAPQFRARALALARERKEAAKEAAIAAKAKRKRNKRLEARLMREIERNGRKLTPEERKQIRAARLINAAKAAREAAIEKLMQPRHMITKQWPAMSVLPGPRSVFELA